MAAASFATWSAVAVLGPAEIRLEVFLGMAGPLAVACGSWVLAERTYRRNPAGLTAVMIVAFGVKLVFFGLYVAVVLYALPGGVAPFVVSFIGYFTGLHLAEALCLRTLFQRGAAPLH
jgi:hypothetical protein